MNSLQIIILIAIIAIILFILYKVNYKRIKPPTVCLITGGVKCGKSLLSVKLSIKDYKRKHFKWWLGTKVFKKDLEEPLYYTNVHVSFGSLKAKKPHRLDKNIRQVTLNSLTRGERFNYKSVIYIQEASLMADNMDFNNKERNVELSLFNKLIGHETRGGSLYYDTQSVLDCHYSCKRVSSSYFFILKNVNFFLFHILYVREMINTENGVNNFDDDVELTMRKVFVPFWYHNKYNRYEFSYLTDDLEKSNTNVTNSGVVSFNPLYVKLADKRKEDR